MTGPVLVSRARDRLTAAPAWHTSLLLFLLFLVVYLITMGRTPDQSNADAVSASLQAWRFALFGDLDLSQFHPELPQLLEVGDRIMSNRVPGIAYLAVPAYWLFGSSEFSGLVPSMTPAAATAATFSAGAVAVVHLLIRRVTAAPGALAAACVFGLATSTWSISSGELWPHGPGQFFLALALLGMAHAQWAAAGLAYACALLIRPVTGIIAAVTGLVIGARTRSWRPVVLTAAGSAVGVGLLLLYNGLVLKSWSLAPAIYGQAFIDRARSQSLLGYLGDILGSLFVPEYGLLIFSPFLLFTIPGLRRAWTGAETWVKAGGLAALAYMLIHLRLNRYWGGYSFNYRYPLEPLTVAAPLLYLSWQAWFDVASALWKRMFWYSVILSVFAQMLSLYVETTPRGLNPWL